MAETASASAASQRPSRHHQKYANRRLYNTATSSYVTLEHLCQMVKEGIDFAVYDAKTGEDITRQVLTQSSSRKRARGRTCCPSVSCAS